MSFRRSVGQTRDFRTRFVSQRGAAPGAASAAASAAPAAASFPTLAISVIATLVATIGVVGVAVTTPLWVDNVHALDAKTDTNRDAIADLESQIQQINSSLPAGNGTVFFDDEWIMARGGAPARQFMFNASLITTIAPGAKRNYAWPDSDGIVVLDTTAATTFNEDAFAIIGNLGQRIEFDASLIPASFFRLYQWPNKNGVVALLSDVIQIAGNTSVFLDSAFAIENDPDTTKRATFDASQITTNTNRSYAFPDLDGTLCLLEPPQALSNKTLGPSNDVTLLTSMLTLQDPVDPTKQLLWDASSQSAGVTVTAALPTFASNGSHELMFATGPSQLVTGVKTFDDSALLIRDPISTQTGRFDSVLLTGSQIYTFPDASGVLVLEDAVQTISNKTLDITNTITVLDSLLTIQGDPNNASLNAQFDANNLTQPRTLEIQDADGVIALLSDLPTSGTWVPVFSSKVNYGGTASTDAGTPQFIRVGNNVMCSVTVRGLTNPGFATVSSLRMTLPISPGGNFASARDGNGQATASDLSGNVPSYGYVKAVGGAEKVIFYTYNAVTTSGTIAVHVNFMYRIL